MGKRPYYHTIMGGSMQREGVTKVYEADEVHLAVATTCLDLLTEPNGPGFFNKMNVLGAVKMPKRIEIEPGDVRDVTVAMDLSGMAGSIQWDYIVRYLQDKYGAELIPVTLEFFVKLQQRIAAAVEANDAERAQYLAYKALAAGHGKKTAGYAAVRRTNGHLVLARLSRRKQQVDGCSEKLEEHTANAVGQKVIKPRRKDPVLIPVMEAS